MPPRSTRANPPPAASVKRDRDCDDDSSGTVAVIPKTGGGAVVDISTTPGKLKSNPRKILYIITSLADGDWNEFGPKKWEYLQAGNSKANPLDMNCLWFVKSYKKEDVYNGTYVSQVDSKTGKNTLVKISNIAAWDSLQVKKFVAEYYQPGNTHLVIGTHGVGDYFWLDEYTTDGGKTFTADSIPVRKIVNDEFKGYQFLSTILDCCLMGELYTMKHFAPITTFVGCGEGFMWSDDVDLDGSMFSVTAAQALSDANVNTYNALVKTGEHYMTKSTKGRNDFGIFYCPAADALLTYITENPTYHKIMQDTSTQIITSKSTKFSKYVFFTSLTSDERFDAQYLLDIWQIALDFPKDAQLVSLFRSVLWWHQGQKCGFGPTSPGMYDFQLSGLSVTVAHTAPKPGKPAAATMGAVTLAMKAGGSGGAAAAAPKKASPKKAVSPTKKKTSTQAKGKK